MVMEVLHEESVHCANHPYRNSTPGGICAFCLQEKLGKLISSSVAVAVFPSSSSSSSPSFRSEVPGSGDGNLEDPRRDSTYNAKSRGGIKDSERKGRLPFAAAHKKKSKEVVGFGDMPSTTPRRSANVVDEEDDSPNRRGFWSFLYSKQKKSSGFLKDSNMTTAATTSAVDSSSGLGGSIRSNDNKIGSFGRVDEDGSPDFKISRSRSMGCGSGDFLERLSTGFVDCSLRRVESQREGKQKKAQPVYKNSSNNGLEGIKERVGYTGILGGLMMNSPSSSSSSYWVASSVHDSTSVSRKSISMGKISHSRSKAWAWVFASPMRAFARPTSRKKEASSSKSSTPNLSAVPSLLSVS